MYQNFILENVHVINRKKPDIRDRIVIVQFVIFKTCHLLSDDELFNAYVFCSCNSVQKIIYYCCLYFKITKFQKRIYFYYLRYYYSCHDIVIVLDKIIFGNDVYQFFQMSVFEIDSLFQRFGP